MRQLLPTGRDDLLVYPIASSPLSDEVARILIAHFGPRAHPDQLVTSRCEEIASLVEAARVTDAVYLGIIAAARELIASGELVELTAIALGHGGIILQPSFILHEDLRSGALVELMPEYRATEFGVFAVYRMRKQLSLKVRRLVDYLVECLKDVSWERAACTR